MTDTQHPEQPEGEGDPARDQEAPAQQDSAQQDSAQQDVATDEEQSAEAQATEAQSSEPQAAEPEAAEPEATEPEATEPEATEAQHSETDGGETQGTAQEPGDQHSVADGESDQPSSESEAEATGQRSGKKTGLLVGLVGSAVVVLAVLLVAAFLWPGFLAGPGDPDDKASEVTSAWGSKDVGQLDAVSCAGPSGKVAKYPPQVMNMVQSVKQTGPAKLLIDTEATVPIDLTLSAQGQTQKLPANVVLGVTDGEWCMKGLQPRK